MPMVTCAECGASVSSAAASCPHCGASKKAMAGRQPITLFGWAWRGLLGLIGLLMVMTAWTTRNTPITNTIAVDPQTPQEHRLANLRLHTAMADATMLKHSLRDPASLTFNTIAASQNGSVVCIKYRARNGYGGMNVEFITFVDDAAGSNSSRVWRRNCKPGKVVNMTEDVIYALQASGLN